MTTRGGLIATDPLIRAREGWARGRTLNEVGRFVEARSVLEQARRLVDARADAESRPAADEVNAAILETARLGLRIRITAALTTFELDGAEAARGELTHTIEQARALGLEDVVALGHVQSGAIAARCGDWPAALDRLNECVPLLGHLAPADLCSVRITRGFVHLALFHVEDAQDDLETACATAKSHDLSDHEFKATHNLGSLAVIAGDLPRALRLMSAADAMGTAVGRDRALVDRAEALVDAGLLEEAKHVLGQALETARRLEHRIDEGDILLLLSRCALLDRDLDTARRFAREAGETFRSRQVEARVAAARLLEAAIDVSSGVNAENALGTTHRWEQGPIWTSEDVEACLVRAEAHLLLQHPDACRAELDRLPAATLRRLPQRLHECTARAQLAHATGDSEAFDEAAVCASRLLAGAHGTAQSLEMRAALAQHVQRLAALDLARVIEAADPERVYATVERWRAASSRASALQPVEDKESRRLLRELRWLRSQAPDDPMADDAATQSRIAELEALITRRALENDSTAGTLADIASAERVVDLLAPRAALVEFTETGGQAYAVAITRDGATLTRLGEARAIHDAVTVLRRDLQASASAFAQPSMRAAVRRAVESSGRMVGSLLLEPLSALTGIEMLIVAPNAPLSALAWHAVPQVDDRAVLVTPSATCWARPVSPPAPQRQRSLAALCGPGLPEAAHEVQEVAELWRDAVDTRTVGGRPDGAADVAKALRENDIVHIAAHGTHQEESPLFSALTMADGPVFAHELRGGVGAEHVVLSACDVGRGRVRVGEEALGFTAALLAYGVRAVVAAVSPVPEQASATMAVEYHRELRAGHDASTALTLAVSRTPGAEPFCVFGSEFSVRSFRV